MLRARSVRWGLLLVIGLMALVIVGSACGGKKKEKEAAAAIPHITIMAKDFEFAAPDQIEGGLVTITLENQGKEPHMAQIARLAEGKTVADVQAAFAKGPEGEQELLSILEVAGGPNTVDPGGHQEVTVKLAPGHYLLLCFVTGADGVPHAAKGMIRPLEVVAPAAPRAVAEPTPDLTVTLKDFAIEIPAKVDAGMHVWKVVNQGPQPHEMDMVKLAEGKTLDDLKALFTAEPSGPPPFAYVGGLGAISPNISGWLTVDLTAGNYVALCFVPDAATGKSHAELGMITAFTVQ